MASHKGSCLCQKIQFTARDLMPHQAHCHCRMCQKFHGAAFSTFAEIKRDNFSIVKGKSFLKVYQADNLSKRYFCSCCGSSLFFESKYNIEDRTIEVALAAFDDDINANPDAHIFTEFKVNWLKLNDELPKYNKYRTD